MLVTFVKMKRRIVENNLKQFKIKHNENLKQFLDDNKKSKWY